MWKALAARLFGRGAPAKVQRAFISHSWSDKALARRLGRRLKHRGIDVWIDEEQLAAGQTLPEALRRAIRESSHFIAVASNNAKASKWVAAEVREARRARATIVPALVEDVRGWRLLDDYIGLDFRKPLAFEDRIDQLAEVIGRDSARGPTSADAVMKDILLVCKERPDLDVLRIAIFDPAGRIGTPTGSFTVNMPIDHDIEFLLSAAYAAAEDYRHERVADHAARMFAQHGLGLCTVARFLAASDTDAAQRRRMTANCTKEANFDKPRIEQVLDLFERFGPDCCMGLYGLLERHHGSLDEEQRKRCTALITTPDAGPEAYRMDAAYALMILPEMRAKAAGLWVRWVQQGYFGERSKNPDAYPIYIFFNFMKKAEQDNYGEFAAVRREYQRRFRSFMRSADVDKIRMAAAELVEADSGRYVGTRELADEAFNALYSAQWEELPEHVRDDLQGAIGPVVQGIADGKLEHDALYECADYMRVLDLTPEGTRVDPSALREGRLKVLLTRVARVAAESRAAEKK
jgi:hypothetical protein